MFKVAVLGAGLSCALSIVGLADPVRAEPTANSDGAPSKVHQDAVASAPSAPSHRLKWIYPRFRLWQWGLSIAATGYFTYSVLQDPRKANMHWDYPLPGDKLARDALVAQGHAGRRKANNGSNALWHVTEFFPFADAIVVPLLFDDFNFDVAWQMTLLNWQGLSVAGAVNRLTHDWMSRDRPALKGCEEYGPEYSEEFCQNDAPRVTQSFISGHASSVYFGAGATCAHHQAFPMYGHRVADIGICALTVAAATTDGLLRIVADAHWMTDVLAGALVGFGAGYGLSYGLHYAWPMQELERAGMMLVPVASDRSFELRLLGEM